MLPSTFGLFQALAIKLSRSRARLIIMLINCYRQIIPLNQNLADQENYPDTQITAALRWLPERSTNSDITTHSCGIDSRANMFFLRHALGL
jgi:hypothetical protein